jgi:hypothetical protein
VESRTRRTYPWVFYGVAALSIFACIQNIRNAIHLYWSPFPAWMTDANSWFSDALAAVFNGVAALASFVYALRSAGRGIIGLPGLPLTGPLTWRERVELRAVLYSFAIVVMVQFPAALVQEYRLWQPGVDPSEHSSWPSTLVMGIFALGIGLAIIAYDRRRIRRERYSQKTLCPKCGYDLRGSRQRCPECGEYVPGGPTPETS